MNIRYLNHWHLKGHINEGGEISEPTEHKKKRIIVSIGTQKHSINTKSIITLMLKFMNIT